MGYLGLTPTTAQQNYLNIDDISGSFNGTTTSFALQVGSVAPTPFPVTNSCLISVGGVIQEPDDTGTSGFRISGGNIVFSSAPGTGEDFFGLILAGADYLNIGANFPDGAVGTPSITFDSDTNTGIYHPSADELSFVTGGSDRVRVDSNGRLGIGTASPTTFVHCSESTNGVTSLSVENSNTGTSARADIIAVSDSADVRFIATSAAYTGVSGWADSGIVSTSSGASGGLILNAQAGGIKFSYGASERARIDSSGRLLVGTSTARANFSNSTFTADVQLETTGSPRLAVISSSVFTYRGGALILAHQKSGSVGGNTALGSGDSCGLIDFQGSDGSEFVPAAQIECEVDASSGSNDMPGRLVFRTTADNGVTPTERMRISQDGGIRMLQNGGALLVNTTTTLSAHKVGIAGNSQSVMYLDRKGNDGNLLTFFRDASEVGVISVASGTVSYGGGHISRWSQLPNNAERTEILMGSVLSNLDEMCVWAYDAEPEVLWKEGDELPEGVQVGDVKTPARPAGTEDNIQLNRMKVSDVEGDPNVAGVFQNWDDDDDTYTNDFFCAMTGDFVIRIAQGVTVERGDLLMSAGDGTAKPQDDDIIRSKTIAKVTSTNVSCTYDDGSYCVPCVLMAC